MQVDVVSEVKGTSNSDGQNGVNDLDAAMQILAAPPTPWERTACAMKGTVALAVPPISNGFRPSNAVRGAVATEVTSPGTGGNPVRLAIARKRGRSTSEV